MRVEGNEEKAVEHGGSLGRARALFPDAPQPYVDLSTGINPHAYPHFDLPAAVLNRLPEPGRLAELEAVAAKAHGAPSASNVVAAPGTQSLLPRLASLLAPGKARVLGPTYEEHAVCAARAGHEVEIVVNVDDLRAASLAILVNPNNPDGRVVPRTELLDLAAALKVSGGLLVVDEAFMDVGPGEESVVSNIDDLPIVVLRSFGKFFGLAGLRLGFAICSPKLAARLRAELGPWAVSGPALEFGLRALADKAWQETMRRRLDAEAERLDALLSSHGVQVAGGTSLYRHVRMQRAAELFDVLGRAGILVRAFADRPEQLRFGLPGTPHEWTRLEAALRNWKSRS